MQKREKRTVRAEIDQNSFAGNLIAEASHGAEEAPRVRLLDLNDARTADELSINFYVDC